MNGWLALSPDELTAIRLSLLVATVAMFASLPFGLAISMVLARREFWGKSLLNGIVHLPLVLPPVVTGYLLLITFGRKGPVGAFLDQHFRHRVLVPLDRGRACLRGDGLPADGARHKAFHRERR